VALYLPTVAELPFKRILELRAAEKPAYDGLQHHLERLIHRGDEIATERELLEYLHRTDAGIAELNRRYKHALKEMVVGELEAVALTAGPPLLGAVSGAGLGMLLAPAVLTVMKNALTDLVHRRPPWGEFVKPIREYRKEVRGFAEHEFYLPWKLFRTGKTWLAA
jgi:hypothetical protein